MAFDYDVAVYLGSLPKIKNHNLKVQVMQAFADGAKRVGARVWIGSERQLKNARLAVMIGWVGMNFSGPHIYFRQDIVNHQKNIGGRVMPIDGSCFKFHDKGNDWLRYSLDDVFYNSGEYANKGADDTRWQQISQDLNLQCKPWNSNGKNILFCLQRDSGWNSKGFDQMLWVEKSIKVLRNQTDRPIHLRPHPANKIDWARFAGRFDEVYAVDSTVRTLQQDIQQAYAGIFFNSSSSVACALAGVPIYVSDESAVTWEIANHHTRNINNPHTPDRTQWLNELSACHWTLTHSRNGDIYRHFESYLPPS